MPQQQDRMPLLYRHIRLDKNEPFYIGIGKTEKRAYQKTCRNNIWKYITNKTNYDVEILFDNLTWDEACEKEKEFIKIYGRIDLKNGCLANQTDGGDGNNNLSLEKRKIISEANKGNKYGLGWKPTEEQKRKMSEGLKGKSNTSKTKFKKGNISWLSGTKGIAKKNSGSFTKENPPKAVSVIDILNNKIYKTIREAAKDVNINEKTLYGMLTGKQKNKSNIRYASYIL